MAHAAAAANQFSAHRITPRIRTPGSAPPHPALPRNEHDNIQIKNGDKTKKSPAEAGQALPGILPAKKASSRGRGSGRELHPPQRRPICHRRARCR
ncbi:Os01g0105450 [Oryza sativa Japonica Group]|uniref:Os01g0105450 protein n=1 Tax=Oryza sativa subsp. japonica TaxID=39947 RepID=A0A0P0UX87_ORYSJ|nr:Os01g0105450 [Oryza sativa Japonica Group]